MEDRFWGRVDRSGGEGSCWLWLGGKHQSLGYGRVHLGGRNGRRVLAHRYAWELTNGHPGVLCVLHRCDNTRCVNPAHLFLGTIADNNADAKAKGRLSRGEPHSFKGERHPAAKLTEADVLAIRIAHAAGERQADLASRYGVRVMAISDVVRGARWSHVGGPLRPWRRGQRRSHGAWRVLEVG